MTGNFYTLVYLPFVGSLCAGSLVLVGYLFLLEIRDFRDKKRCSRRRRARPEGAAVMVRGLGFRSEPTVASLTRASQIGTLSFGSLSNRGTIRTVRVGSRHQMVPDAKPQVVLTRTTGAERIFTPAGRG